MAKVYQWELYDDERQLELWLNDPACVGMKPLSIYRIPFPANEAGYALCVWWECEDSND
jgi:hypothetical protein